MPLIPPTALRPLAESDQALSQIQLIATDMDGTLTIDEKFTPQLFQALQKLQQAQIAVIVITGRSAGWVNAVNHYFPVAGAICENGGLFYQGDTTEFLVDIPDITQHRQNLAAMFQQLQQRFPQIQEASDNRFRLTDWTFDVAGLSQADLAVMDQQCAAAGWGFTYSTVQCHIKPHEQSKANGLQYVLQQHFSAISLAQVMTIGDSPNDVSLFNPVIFPNSTGVQNVSRYTDQLAHLPRFITPSPEGKGFCELVDRLICSK
ncbi:HAD family hydrolase [Romeriopsis navalis]|nr:HAD-IIB family hydrolase [Romeriopsis navalis]